MAYHIVEKTFWDYAADIEAVSIHYAVTALGKIPKWEKCRSTRFMPIADGRLRRKLLKLPARVADPNAGTPSARYLLHYYFEIFQSGDRHYSPLYTEEVQTEQAVTEPAAARILARADK
jgi:hypothetical protein